jgi:hypothetical protein
VLGAVLFQSFLFKSLLDRWPSLASICALAAAVGFIYVVDRWLDNRLFAPADERHLFFNTHRVPTAILAIFWMLLGLGTIYYLPISLLRISCILGFSMLVYWFAWSQSWLAKVHGFKEFCTAFLYAAGIFASIFAHLEGVGNAVSLNFLALVLIAFQNLYLFTRVDAFLRIVEIAIVLYLIFLVIYLHDFMRVVPFFVTFGIHVVLRVRGLNLRSAIIAEMAFFSPLLYLLYGIISK